MPADAPSRIHHVLTKCESEVLTAWIEEQLSAITLRLGLLEAGELREQSSRFLALLRAALEPDEAHDPMTKAWRRSAAELVA